MQRAAEANLRPGVDVDVLWRRRRLATAFGIAGIILIAGAYFLFDTFSPYGYYCAVVNRLIETGYIEPRFAYFLAPLPTLLFVYAAFGLIKAFVFGRKARAAVMATALALLGLGDAAIMLHNPDEPVNPITKGSNYRWYRAEPTADFPEGEIIYTRPWWNTNGKGRPVYDLNDAIIAEHDRQRVRQRARQASLDERQKDLDAKAAALAERAKEVEVAESRIRAAGAADSAQSIQPPEQQFRIDPGPALREPQSRNIRIDREPVRSNEKALPEIYLWVTGVELFKDRTVVRLACRSVDETREGYLLSPSKPKRELHRKGMKRELDDFRNTYLTNDEDRAFEFIRASTDFPKVTANGSAFDAREIRPYEKFAFQIEFEPVPLSAEHLKIFHRQFGFLDIPLGTPVSSRPAASSDRLDGGASSGPEEIPLGQTQPVPVGQGEYVLTLRSGRRVGTSFYLYVQYLNQAAEELDLILDGKETALFDELGNQYTPVYARFSGNRREAEIPNGLVVNAVFRFDSLDVEARAALVLRIGTRWSSNTHRRSMISTGQRSSGEFHDVPLGKQSRAE